MQSVSFLVGSGVSQAAGLPGVVEITKRVLSGKEVFCHSDQVFYFGQPMFAHMGWPDEFVPRIVELLAMLREDLDSFTRDRHFAEPTYEDLYHVCSRMELYLGGYVPDVTADLYFRSVENRTAHLLEKRPYDIGSKTLMDLARMACDYIIDVAWHMLDSHDGPSPMNQMLSDCNASSTSTLRCIATTNYERLIENGLDSSRITYSDGFANTGGVRFYGPDAWPSSNDQLVLLKLHGSLDWYQLMTNDSGPRQNYIAKAPFDPYATTSPDGRPLVELFGRPVLLAGTHNKYEAYARSIYAHMSCLFWQRLRQTDALIVTGFGFGDRGINDRIIDWLSWAKPNRLVVIDPYFSRIEQVYKPGLEHLISRARSTGVLRVVEKNIQDVCWGDIEGLL